MSPRGRPEAQDFMVSTVEYLDHVISQKGIRLKTKVIVSDPTPQNVTQLKSFLGLLNYYSKFLIDDLTDGLGNVHHHAGRCCSSIDRLNKEVCLGKMHLQS